ncbi:GyrI-like domain-containing protein [Actinomadura sp. HBU206391]|uniref:GyrI-like domain-containing protein n=1 Tax=Actinomadura sp. HBU206391 TaxID=2731692 RepID=UPI00164F8E3B|nr:GyrI-like domain-containing protein [Actinomadura sp. HBU206391]MBC6462871.1 GyrI-like domain-containing protein [Actinomadura sp. HBU206391]
MTTIEFRRLTPQPVVSIRGEIPVAELTQTQSERLLRLWRFLRARDIAPAGPPFVRYHTFGDIDTDVEIGVPVVDDVTGESEIIEGELPGGRAVVTAHLGAHDDLGDAYTRIEDWLAAQGARNGPAWEVYEWIDLAHEPNPSAWPAPADWRTELVQPIT